MNSKNYILFSILGLFFLLFYSGTNRTDHKLLKPLTNDHYNYIDINEIMMWVSNNGDGSHDPVTDGNGFYWPGGRLAIKSAIFEDGLIWGGMVNGEIRVNGNTHRQGLEIPLCHYQKCEKELIPGINKYQDCCGKDAW